MSRTAYASAAAHCHRGFGGRRQEHPDRPAAARHRQPAAGPPGSRHRRRGRRRPGGAVRWSARRTRTGHHHRRRLPLLLHRPRSYILADTPGHERYTRNMFTGASNAHVAILLVDARAGVLRQTRRHARIAKLLGIKHFVATVNKIDLVDFDQDRFTEVEDAAAPDGGAAGRHGHHGDPDRGQARGQRRAPLRPHAVVRAARRCWSTWKASNWPRRRPSRPGCGCRCSGCRGRPPTCAAATPGGSRRARSVSAIRWCRCPPAPARR